MNPAIMEKKRILEKRRAERIPLVMRVEYKYFTTKKDPEEGVCEDISGKGVRLRVDRPFKRGQYIKTLLYLPNDPTPVHIVDKVIWCKREGGIGSHFELGAEHITISRRDDDRVRYVFFICESLIERNINKGKTVTYAV